MVYGGIKMSRLVFIKDGLCDSKKMIEVRNKKNEILGHIFWRRDWKCFVWEQLVDVVMSIDCL